MTEEQRDLLQRIIAVNSPIEFDEEFATDDDMDALEDALDAQEIDIPHYHSLKNLVANAPAKASDGDEFI
jgi:hypothetical protein